MENIYVYDNEISKEEVLELFDKELNKYKIYNSYKTEELNVEEKYMVYSFIEGKIKDINYFYVKNETEKNGVIDGEYLYRDKFFLLNELKTESFILTNKTIDEFNILNNEYNKNVKLFIDGFNERVTNGICQRHNLRLTNKNTMLDVGMIKNFDEYSVNYYLEKVFVINHYNKKNYRSVYSVLNNEFYELDYPTNDKFKDFLKTHKKSVVKIPKEYLKEYYKLSFKIWLETNEQLKYITESDMYQKAKLNIKHKKNIQYYEYLDKLIFYFRKSKYLSLYENDSKRMKDKLLFYYLTLNYNNESGLELAKLIKLGIVNGDYVKMLEISSNLGSIEAKNMIMEYYSNPKTYNENMLKRYS